MVPQRKLVPAAVAFLPSLDSMSRSLALLAFTVLACSAYAQYPGAEPVTGEFQPGFNSITPSECKPWLTFLAGPACEGRGSGQPGYFKAANFMAGQFKKYGLKPMGDNGTYFQGVPFTRSLVDESTSLQVGGMKLQEGRDLNMRLSDNADLSGPVVFIREKGADTKLPDTAKLEGKIVILSLAKGVPGRARFALFQQKPALVLTVGQGITKPDWTVIPETGRGNRLSFPSGRISDSAAKALTAALGLDPSFADPDSGADGVVVSDDKATGHLIAKVRHERVMVPNVVGLLEGTDPTLKAEYVGIGAHLDHLGKQGKTVYPGADDDGSGTTALIALMKAFHDSPIKPKRSILFMNFCGEELGLIGSGYLANHPMVPLDKMVCELQMDMVGRNSEGKNSSGGIDNPAENVDTIRLVGSKRISTELNDLIQDENKHVGFRFKYDEEAVYTRSDHYNFAAKGVPIAFLFDGFHPDYHQPTDTVNKINWDKIANSAKLYFLVVMAAADRPVPFKHDVANTVAGR